VPVSARARESRRVWCAGLLSILMVLAGAVLTAAPMTATAASARVTKVLVVVEAHQTPAKTKAAMPYISAQARRYGYASRERAVSGLSLPNYLAMVSGRTFGVADDAPPSAHRLTGRTVFGQALARGRTARTYSQGMTSTCRQSDAGGYSVAHNAWAYFTDERAACRRYSVSTARLRADVASGSLPNLGLVVPDRCHGGYTCAPAVADSWFKTLMLAVKAGPDWRAGRLAVVLTTDLGGRRDHRVMTVVLHPSLSGRVVDRRLSHYSLTRFMDDVVGARPLHRAATAPDLARAFGLTVGQPVARTPAPTQPPQQPAGGDGVQAAVAHGWGPVVAGDEFGYSGAPNPKRWSVYVSAGQGGNGLRSASAWHVDGSVATVTGDPDGTTGGMSAKFDHRKYGRWEIRMRTNARDVKYHAVAILWPDVKVIGQCPEVDYAEAGSTLTAVGFFLHYGCKGAQQQKSISVDTTQWHNYAVEWTRSGIIGYLDGVEWFHDTDPSHQPPGPMHQTLQLDWFPDSAHSPTARSTMSVDWVRVYNLG
jgi:Phosphoesterase family/Glycosyl hydrolases family 16